ncbi:MAG: hypothetical protein SH819_04775 [Cytophagales bacterium]|nr:hypothetical protein [Cytophagales bacterium]
MRKSIFFITFVLFMIHAGASAQPKFNLYPDSIRIEFPDLGALVIFEMSNYPESNDFIRNFPQTLGESLEYIRKSSSSDLTSSPPMRIEIQSMPEGLKEEKLSMKPYGEKKLVRISPLDPAQTTMTVIKDKGIVEMLPPGWELYLNSKTYRVKVYAATFSSLEAIATQDFGAVVDKINADEGMKTLWRKSIESQIIVRENKIENSSAKYIFPGDNISLTLNAGVGLFSNIIYPELSLIMGLTFKDRYRRPNFRTSLIYNNLFFAERTNDGFDTHINSFLSGSFEVNFNRKTHQAHWSGLGIGWLTRSSNNYFTGNTAKFFITHSLPGSRFSMVPEFYLTDNLKKFTFGMTLKYSF